MLSFLSRFGNEGSLRLPPFIALVAAMFFQGCRQVRTPLPMTPVISPTSLVNSDRSDIIHVASSRPSVELAKSSMLEAYPPSFWCGYREIVARHAAGMLRVTRWFHNGTSWVSVRGALTDSTVRAVIRILRSEDRAAVVVINAAGLRVVDPLSVVDLQVVCTAVAERGVVLELVDAPPELATVTEAIAGAQPSTAA